MEPTNHTIGRVGKVSDDFGCWLLGSFFHECLCCIEGVVLVILVVANLKAACKGFNDCKMLVQEFLTKHDK